MKIQIHADDTTQSDYKGGAVDMQAFEAEDCFDLGVLAERLSNLGMEAVRGPCGAGMMLRVPLQKRRTSGGEK